MTTTTNQIEKLLADLSSSVEEYQRANPLVAAWALLRTEEPGSYGLLSQHAARLIRDVYENDPTNPYALHHLAVIYHGYAYQQHLKEAGDSEEVVKQWRMGLKAWSGLVRSDAFWKSLKSRWENLREENPHDMLLERLLDVDLEAVRRQLPGHLLNLHQGIVQDTATERPEVARAHFRMIVESGFEEKEIDRVRRQIYRSSAGNVDEMCGAKDFDAARAGVKHYLEIDPDGLQAHCDMLRIAAAECEFRGKGHKEVDRRSRVLKEAEPHATCQAVKQNASQPLVADALHGYYCARASLAKDRASDDSKRGISQGRLWDEALDAARQAVRHERVGQKARQLLSVVCFDGGMSDLNREGSDYRAAMKFVDAGLAVDPQDAAMYVVKAYYCLRKDDTNGCDRALNEAERYNKIRPDMSIRSLIQKLRSVRSQKAAVGRAGSLLKQIVEAMDSKRFSKAVSLIDEALGMEDCMESEIAGVLYLRKTICLFVEGDRGAARDSYHEARRRLSGSTDSNLRTELTKIGVLLGESPY